MADDHWRTSTDPEAMLAIVRDRASDRKLRLFQVACCRRMWRFVTDPASRALVGLVERAADGPVPEAEFRALPYDWLTDDGGGPGAAERHAFLTAGHVGYSLFAPLHGSPFPPGEWRDAVAAADGAATVAAEAAGLPDGDDHLPAYRAAQAAERAALAGLVRDLFGDPFRPVTFEPSWRTPDALGLARGIYEGRAFERMPFLADALMDAGCNDEQVIGHCRSNGPHVRGCWVVDGVLGPI